MRILVTGVLVVLTWANVATADPLSSHDDASIHWPTQFVQEVDRRLDVPVVDQ